MTSFRRPNQPNQASESAPLHPTLNLTEPRNITSHGGVILLHGIARTAKSLAKMQQALTAHGYATLNVDYESRRKSLEDLADDIHPSIEKFGAQLDGPVHFVGHSMGGLLTRVYLARYRPRNLGRVVMLGTPNGGSEIADVLKRFKVFRKYYGPAGLQLTTERDSAWKSALPPIDYPVGVIAGSRTVNPILSSFIVPKPNDGKVSVENTKLDGMSDHLVIRKSHPFLMTAKLPIGQTIAFLREGRFAA